MFPVGDSIMSIILFSSRREPGQQHAQVRLPNRYTGSRLSRVNKMCLPPGLFTRGCEKICFEFKSVKNKCASYQKISFQSKHVYRARLKTKYLTVISPARERK